MLGGLGERATHDEMNFVDSLRGEPFAVLATGCGERCAEVVEVVGADRPERVSPDDRDDVALDHPPVAVGRGRWHRVAQCGGRFTGPAQTAQEA